MKSLLLTVTTLWVCFAAHAGIIEWTNRIQTPHGGTPVEIGEPEAIDSVRASVSIGSYLDAQIVNRISLGIDIHYPKYFGSAMDVAVQVKVKRWDVAMAALSDTLIWLNVKYSPSDTLQMIALNKVEFAGAYKLVFSVEQISVNGSTETILPANLYVQGDIFIERYRELSSSPLTASFLKVDRDCNGTDDALEISWSPVIGAEEYQLEWAYVNDYAATLSGSLPQSALNYDFKFNSTRITTAATTHTISLVFDRGWVVYRVRAVGVLLSDPSQYIFGPWNVAEKGPVDLVSSNKVHITGMEQHEGDVNWQYSATYAEQGKHKEVVSYFDGSLRNRQTVSRINSDNNIVVGETIYDHQGRPAITVLPVPVTDSVCSEDPYSANSIHLYRNFNKVDGTNAYTAKDFDISDTTALCEVGAAPMNTSSGASNYYSSDNPNQLFEQGYLPDANGYPFVQTEYTPDNTGRIRRQGGAGQEFQIGSGHETRYLYGQPNQLELDRLFGSEVGNALRYKKNVIVDAHGQASVLYLDQEQRTIASALAGDAPANLEGIESESADSVLLEVDAFASGGNEVGIDNRSMVFSTELLVAYQSAHTFSYDFAITPVDMACLEDICVDCVYDLTIELIDECGVNLAPASLQNRLVGKFTGDAENGYSFHAACVNPVNGSLDTTFTASLAPGAYSLNKKLTVNQAAIDSLVAIYLRSDCAMTLQDFESITLANIDTSGCAITCDNCFEQLGTIEDFIADGFGNSNDYYLRVEECQQICQGDASYCDIMSTLLQMDMSPGGQYGEYLNPNTGAHDYEAYILSIYNETNFLPNSSANWRIPVLNTPQGQQSIYVDDNGQRSRIYLSEDPLNPGTLLPAQFNPSLIQIDSETGQPFIYPENLATTADFINEFQQSWGRSLMFYHPEYCYYETCLSFEDEIVQTDAFTSGSFDMLLQQTSTIDQAVANGFVNFDGTTYTLTNWFAPAGGDNTEDMIAWDPFVYYSSDFNTDWCIGNYGTALQNKFTNYQYIDGAWRSMPEIAALMARCGNNFASSYPTSCYNFGHSVLGVWNPEVLNHEWALLRSMYLSEKQKIQRELSDCKALKECNAYNGCIGNEEFNPFELMIPTGPSSIPFTDDVQPCSMNRYGLYRYKIRRFTDESSLPVQDVNDVAYEVYLQTGQCPVEFTLQSLFASLAQQGNLDAPDYLLNSNPNFSAVAQALSNFSIPGTLPQIQHQGSVSGTTLNIDWMILPSTVYTSISMNLVGGSNWNNVTDIVNLFVTGPYTFKAKAVIYDPVGDSTYVEPITGTITMELPTSCDFAPDCSSNELAKKLTVLLNTLHLDNQVGSTTAIDITPYVSSTYGTFSGLTNTYIQNAAGVGPNLSYIFNGTNTAKIYDPTGTAANGLYIQFNGAITSGVLATISHFGNLISTGNNSFEMEVFFTAGGSTTIQGALFRETDGERIGIKAGECDLPTPAACQTQAHENFDALQALLHDVLVVQNYDGTGQIDLYSSVEITPSIIAGLPLGVDSTTSTLSANGDTLVISAGTCDLMLSTTTPYSFAQIIGIKDFTVSGTPSNYQSYYDFECTGVFVSGADTLEATIKGTSCLSIKACDPCITPHPFTNGEEEGPASLYSSNPSATSSTEMQYDENLETITDYETLRTYLYDTYIGTERSTYCENEYESYLFCLNQYNDSVLALGPGSGLFLIPDTIPYEAFEVNGLCADRCVGELCSRLYAILAGTTTVPNQNALIQYINFTNYCGVTPIEAEDPCKDAYAHYLNCIAYYNSQADTLGLPGVTNVATYEVFAAGNLCTCVDEYCSRLNDLITGVHSFGPTIPRGALEQYLTITSCTSAMPCEPTPVTGPPAVMPDVTIANNCVEMLINQAYFDAQIMYESYVDSLSNALINQYISHCLTVQENFTYTYADKLYHFTLYYYDQAGNKIKTIPPAGVEKLDLTSSYSPLSQQIAADRANRTKTVYTNHRLATRYEYNSLNQLVYQSTPDTDPMNIFELTLPNGLHSALITYKIQMVNENVGYLAGEINGAGAIYRTNDGGTTWQKINNLVGADLKRAIVYDNGVDSSNGIAIGEKGTVLTSVDAGVTWTLFPTVWQIPGLDIIHNANDLAYINTAPGYNTFIIVGENRMVVKLNTTPSGPSMAMLTTGITAPATASVTGVTTNGSDFLIIVNDPSTNTATTYRLPSGGTSWVEENSFTAGALKDVHLYNATGAYAVGEDGRMYKKTDAASATERWKHVQSDLVNTIHTVRFFNEQSGAALVELQPGEKYLMRTFDGGQTWMQISDDPFNHLSISNNRSHILAVGNDGKIEVVIPGNTLVTVPVASGLTSDLTAGWLDNQADGNGNSNPHIIVATASGKVRYTSNGFAIYPSWETTDHTALIGSDNITDIRAERGWTSNQIIYGAALTQAGKLYRVDKQAGVNVVDLFDFTGAGTGHAGLATMGGKIFSVDQAAEDLVSVSMSASLVDYTVIGSLDADIAAIAGGADHIIGVGTSGAIVNAELNGTYTSLTVQDESTRINPNKLYDVTMGTGNFLCAGEDGTLYQRVTSPSAHWRPLRTRMNETIHTIALIAGGGAIATAGSDGLFVGGAISGNDYLWQHAQTTSGATVQSQLGTTTLHDIYSNGTNLYAVGDNGKVVYSANAVSQGFSIATTAGGKNLYGVAAFDANSVLIAGASGHLETRMGVTASTLNTIQIPPVRDLHFVNATTGTYLADNYVVRTTSSAGADWNVIYPNTPQAPTNAYRKVWTKSAAESYIFADNTPYKTVASGMSSPVTVTGYTINNVRALAQGSNPNELHLVNYQDVVKLNLSSHTATNLTSLGSGAMANAIHVFRNGSYLAVGENGLYQHFSAANTLLEGNPSELAGQHFNAIAFTDNITGTLVGDNGAYFTTSNPNIDAQGYLTAVDWSQKTVTGSNDPLGATGMDIYTIAFATPTSGVFGGTYTAGGPFTHPYVRKVFDANARYSSRFFYDKLGRLVVSQNARQYNGTERKFSYMLYDHLGRVTQAGEKTENAGTSPRFASVFGTSVSNYFNPSVIDDAQLQAWITAPGARKEVTHTYYDSTLIAGLPTEFNSDLPTQNKRVVHVAYEEVYDADDQTYDHATHYRYDIHGNVKTLLQDNRKMAVTFPSIASQRFKRMDYVYDLVSGNVHRMSVQNSEADQWHHAFAYDADNRLTSVYTNTATPMIGLNRMPKDLENELIHNSDWQNDARYFYYDHGPLARMEIGENNLQGVDYYYTLHGWLKGVNSSVLDQANDPGKDSDQAALNATFAKDVFGYGLHYFAGDYAAINGTGQQTQASVNNASHAATNSHDLYNGNIRYMQTSITNPNTRAAMPMLNAYKYDQLNRLVESRSYEAGLASNVWNPLSYGNSYYNAFTYNTDGNILSQQRHKRDGTKIEDLTYRYQRNNDGELIRNRLYYVNDAIASNVDSTDIDDMGLFEDDYLLINSDNNYAYDEEGRLIKDLQEEIEHIVWRVDGKVKSIVRTPSSEKKNVSFDYNSYGQRVAKHVYDNQTDMLEKSTYYMLDADGKQLAMYEHTVDSSQTTFYLAERNIYGSSRLGSLRDTINMQNPQQLSSYGVLGNRYYELSNHLGNVSAVINDRIVALDEDSNDEVDGYQVGIVSIADYSPFGVQLDGRTFDNQHYRYQFNGMEVDNEVKGNGNSIDFGARMYDPRIGRFLSTDAYKVAFPSESPYMFAGNSPVVMIDLNGDFKIIVTKDAKDTKGSEIKIKRFESVVNDLKNYLLENPNVMESIIDQTMSKGGDREKMRQKILNDFTPGQGPEIRIVADQMYAARGNADIGKMYINFDYSFVEFLENDNSDNKLRESALNLMFSGVVIHEYTHAGDAYLNGRITTGVPGDLGKQQRSAVHGHRGLQTEVYVTGLVPSTDNTPFTYNDNGTRNGSWFYSEKDIKTVMNNITLSPKSINSSATGTKSVLPKDQTKPKF